MTVDYDGLIVGGTVQGRMAAAIAAREGARVALVEASATVEQTRLWQGMVELLAQAGHSIHRSQLGGQPAATGSTPDWHSLRHQAILASEITYPHLTLDSLANRGVDVIESAGQFSPKPRLAFSTAERHLRARGYVLCPSTQVTVPSIPGLADTPYTTVDDLHQWPSQPEAVLILGRSPTAIALAQSLAWLGTRVTLISRGEQLLPTEDADISLFVESLLRAAGVNLYLNVRPATVQYNHGFSLALEDGGTLQAQHLVLGTARQPNGVGLNLSSIGIRPNANYLPVNDRLNACHPRLFACGPALGGYWADWTDFQDVPIAVRNILYLPLRKLTWLHRPSYLPTVPNLARVGMTASQAQRWYGPAARVLQVPLGEAIAAHLAEDMTGFCRWIVHRDGRLLGAQICGASARELIQTVAMAMQKDWRMQHLDRWPHLPYSYGEICYHLAETWQHQRWQPGTWRRDWAENWFNWRRSRPYR